MINRDEVCDRDSRRREPHGEGLVVSRRRQSNRLATHQRNRSIVGLGDLWCTVSEIVGTTGLGTAVRPGTGSGDGFIRT